MKSERVLRANWQSSSLVRRLEESFALEIRQSYAYAVGRVRVLETRLLDRTRILRMLDARSVSDVFRVLAEMQYGQGARSGHESAYERVLYQEIGSAYDLISEFVPDPRILEVLRLKYDLHNVKVVLKSAAQREERRDLFLSVGSLSYEEIQRLSGVSETPESERTYWNPAIDQKVESRAEVLCRAGGVPMGEGEVDPRELDIQLDKAYFCLALELSQDIGSEFLLELFRMEIDRANLQALLRLSAMDEDEQVVRKTLIPSGHLDPERLILLYRSSVDELLASVDRDYQGVLKNWTKGEIPEAIEHLLSFFAVKRREHLERSKMVTFGPEPIVSYLLAKESEADAVRTVLVGKANGIGEDLIKARLGKVYA